MMATEQANPNLVQDKLLSMQRNTSARRNLAKFTGGDDNISEFDMNSDTRSMQNSANRVPAVKQNNLMGFSGQDFHAQKNGLMNQSMRSDQVTD